MYDCVCNVGDPAVTCGAIVSYKDPGNSKRAFDASLFCVFALKIQLVCLFYICFALTAASKRIANVVK